MSVFTEEAVRRGWVGGGVADSVCPRQALLGSGHLSVQKSASRASHPFLTLISPDSAELCLFSAVFTVAESVYVTHM